MSLLKLIVNELVSEKCVRFVQGYKCSALSWNFAKAHDCGSLENVIMHYVVVSSVCSTWISARFKCVANFRRNFILARKKLYFVMAPHERLKNFNPKGIERASRRSNIETHLKITSIKVAGVFLSLKL